MSSVAELLKVVPANVRASEGAGTTTLTRDDTRRHIFNLSAGRTCVLPTAGVKSGEIWTIEQRSAGFALIVQASDLSEIERIERGHVVLVALQDTPVSSGHWTTLSVKESGFFLLSYTGPFTANNQTIRFRRQDKKVTLEWPLITGTSTVAAPLTSGANVPSRFRPTLSGSTYFIKLVADSAGGGDQSGLVVLTSGGNTTIYKTPGSGNFSNSGTVGLYGTAISYTLD